VDLLSLGIKPPGYFSSLTVKNNRSPLSNSVGSTRAKSVALDTGGGAGGWDVMDGLKSFGMPLVTAALCGVGAIYFAKRMSDLETKVDVDRRKNVRHLNDADVRLIVQQMARDGLVNIPQWNGQQQQQQLQHQQQLQQQQQQQQYRQQQLQQQQKAADAEQLRQQQAAQQQQQQQAAQQQQQQQAAQQQQQQQAAQQQQQQQAALYQQQQQKLIIQQQQEQQRIQQTSPTTTPNESPHQLFGNEGVVASVWKPKSLVQNEQGVVESPEDNSKE
jgi:flagellar biosynthesis GTPase FlhF